MQVADAEAALAGLTTFDDLLSAAVAQRVRVVGEDPTREVLLVMARLDPRDEESWARDLQPSSDDFGFQRSAAARLTVLLAGVCDDAQGIATPPAFVEAHLEAAGWPSDLIEVCLRGRPVSSLFEALSPGLAEVVRECRPWLVGGWLDHATAGEMLAQLSASASDLDRVRGEVARELSASTGLRFEEVDAALQASVADVGVMLSETDATSVLWIIQD